ncbi:putative dual-specificity RNA methyltransferase RlmN [Spirochaetia bacterium]|nr:putative dual-specificity RNA methyltransferase RlmN [Spirochaetia bacterium]
MSPTLSGMPLTELENFLQAHPKFRAKQIFNWIHKGAASFSEMTNLPASLREDLETKCSLRKTKIVKKFEDSDGTIKLQIGLEDGNIIESVILSDGVGRKTACLSTQVGCPMGCVFCKTGSLGFLRNLDAAEMVEQFLHIRAINNEIGNIVFMGMGEPLLNLNELQKTLSVLCESMSPRRITISTCGIISGIKELIKNGMGVRLAVSLTTADEELRRQLMPVCISNPLQQLREVLVEYQEKYGKRITLEAVLLGGLNTRQKDIDEMVNFARGLDTIINLIPWNPITDLIFNGTPLKEPSLNEVNYFARELEKNRIKTVIRYKKGRNIGGACGQLGVVKSVIHAR